jgi:hypothetical protein
MSEAPFKQEFGFEKSGVLFGDEISSCPALTGTAQILTIGWTEPWSSLHEKRGSTGPAGTMVARLQSALMGQMSSCGTTNTDWVSPGWAVFVDGKTSILFAVHVKI